MQTRLTTSLAVGAIAFAAACTPQPVVTTTRTVTTTTSSGDVLLTDAGGMWVDSVGGTWIDTTGTLWMGGRRGRTIGLLPADISTMTNANIVEHVATGDSLEVALSQLGVERAQSSAVHDFAQRMVNEHSAHSQAAKQLGAQAGLALMPSAADTADAAVATRMFSRLSNTSASPAFDRQLMRAEVVMHQHMFRELNALRPQATAPAREFIDQTLPVVEHHLADAQSLWHQLGGTMNSMNP